MSNSSGRHQQSSSSTPLGFFEDQPRPYLYSKIRDAMRLQGYARNTEKAYLGWIRRFLNYFDRQHPRSLGPDAVADYLTHLAVELEVVSSTQTQALSSLLFLYEKVLGIDVGQLDGLVRARKSHRLPVVMTRREVQCDTFSTCMVKSG